MAAIAGWSKGKVSAWATQSGLKPSDAGRLLDVYDVRGAHCGHLLPLAKKASGKGWWDVYTYVPSEEHLALIALAAGAAGAGVAGQCRSGVLAENPTLEKSSRAIKK